MSINIKPNSSSLNFSVSIFIIEFNFIIYPDFKFRKQLRFFFVFWLYLKFKMKIRLFIFFYTLLITYIITSIFKYDYLMTMEIQQNISLKSKKKQHKQNVSDWFTLYCEFLLVRHFVKVFMAAVWLNLFLRRKEARRLT